MVSKSTASSSKFLKGSEAMEDLPHKLTLLKRDIQSQRLVSIREKLEKNTKMIQAYVSELQLFSESRTEFTARSNDLLSLRMTNPLCKFSGFFQSSADKDDGNSEEVVFSSTAKLPPVEKIPPYTSWIFLDRNQRMADDQSVAGRRRIYYDQHGGEALICSDSEEEVGELEGGKLDFSEGEDHLLRVTLLEYGARIEVLDTLTRFIGGTSFQIQERWNMLQEKDQMNEKQNLKNSREEGSEDNVFLDKSLNFALDSFDNVFCRRCLVFDCRLHGCSQNLILPLKRQTYDPEEEHKPCGSQCCFQMNESEYIPNSSEVELLDGSLKKAVEEEATVEGNHEKQELDSDDRTSSFDNKQKSVVPTPVPDVGESSDNEVQIPTACSEHVVQTQKSDSFSSPIDVTGDKLVVAVIDKGEDIAESSARQARNPIIKHGCTRSTWKQFEKDLCLKGMEIFGRNSCCIARNMLSGLKTCKEVSIYMYNDVVAFPRGSSSTLSSFFKDGGKADMENMDPEMPIKSRICRKRGRTRKFNKSSWKSAGHPSLWRRIIDGKDQPLKQYVPCACPSSCGKQCACQQSGTCCEKYCGCSQSCKNRFRGCHCAKSQCRSRQCPCFAAGRECDPDVCRHCWVSCGDVELGEPRRQGDGNCGNMKLLLRQQQRILLGRSDIAGWGVFIKNSVNKNDYLGEYTGELISHREADRRGKIYDLADSSFLFDLNDQYVLDAYRKGDKLKFANHSATPNCYAKVMSVAGDHRVGIFAKENIEAGEELFYDYRYGPDQAIWAQKPERSKRDGSPVHQGRAKKHQSGSNRL